MEEGKQVWTPQSQLIEQFKKSWGPLSPSPDEPALVSLGKFLQYDTYKWGAFLSWV